MLQPKHTIPTGLVSVPPPGPAIPVTATATCARLRLSAPDAISRAVSSLTAPWLLGVVAAFFAIGIWACGRTGRDLGAADHGAMNWDEVVAMMLILVLIPDRLEWWVCAFGLFRFFDIAKPPPIGHIDRTVKGGFGVMLDDIVAAFYTLLLMAIVKRVFF